MNNYNINLILFDFISFRFFSSRFNVNDFPQKNYFIATERNRKFYAHSDEMKQLHF